MYPGGYIIWPEKIKIEDIIGKRYKSSVSNTTFESIAKSRKPVIVEVYVDELTSLFAFSYSTYVGEPKQVYLSISLTYQISIDNRNGYPEIEGITM